MKTTAEPLRIGTRGSGLARTQSQWVADRLAATTGRSAEIVVISTRGDQVRDRPLREIGGKGLFTKEIEDALHGGDIDLAVHSMKDMPTEQPPGLIFGAVPEREDPRDALVGCALADLPQGAAVGTGSPRRQAALLALRPDLEMRGLRGNVPTRIRKRTEQGMAAVVLAYAGLLRLGLDHEAAEALDPEIMVPAAGQGALAVQCREGDGAVREALATIHHLDTAICVDAERAFLVALGGGCSSPIACHARLLPDGRMEVLAFAADERGGAWREQAIGAREEGEALGRALGLRLKARL